MRKYSGALILMALFAFAVLACQAEPGKPGNMPRPRPIPIRPRPPHPRLRREAEDEEIEELESFVEESEPLERVRRAPGKPGNMPRPRPIPIRPRPPHPRLRREAEDEEIEELESFVEDSEPLERVRREPGKPGNMPRPRPIPIRPRPPHPRLRREAEEDEDLESFIEEEESLLPLERVRREPNSPNPVLNHGHLGTMPVPRPFPNKRQGRDVAQEEEVVAEESLSPLERVRREPGKPGNMPKPRPIPIKPRPPHPRL
ncbi:apidaecins type 73-like isoform X4 [Leptopilina heterotoma]|uniref:apidaecins type 73-like isoform X4 n=1 Tax=Leptopilina heterotoma TaxID=63436 RepID=UPI001CA9CBE5|nr:apidaecins type 73-like isoform X4 [Leptopilina heterotoma]